VEKALVSVKVGTDKFLAFQKASVYGKSAQLALAAAYWHIIHERVPTMATNIDERLQNFLRREVLEPEKEDVSA